MCIETLFAVDPNWKQPKKSTTRWMDKAIVLYPHTGIRLQRQLYDPCLLTCNSLPLSVPDCMTFLPRDFSFFGHVARLVGSQFPDQGLNPHPRQWEHRVLTLDPQGIPCMTSNEETTAAGMGSLLRLGAFLKSILFIYSLIYLFWLRRVSVATCWI